MIDMKLKLNQPIRARTSRGGEVIGRYAGTREMPNGKWIDINVAEKRQPVKIVSVRPANVC